MTAEALREKLESLSLHPGVSASDYVNKYMMQYQELEKIPEEGMSPSHVKYSFLRNIHDDRYEMTVKYLRNAGSDLQECITAIRKEERDQIRRQIGKRKFQGTISRLKYDSNNSDDYTGENDDQCSNIIHQKRARKLSGAIQTTKGGFILIPNDQWATMDDKDKKFVQKYNAKVKHNEPLDKLSVPNGVMIQTNARRAKSSPEEDNDEEEDDQTNKYKKKKLHFVVQSTNNES
jgi:hypothetical protein